MSCIEYIHSQEEEKVQDKEKEVKDKNSLREKWKSERKHEAEEFQNVVVTTAITAQI